MRKTKIKQAYTHGYRRQEHNFSSDWIDMMGDHGFAFAASHFSRTGWVIKEGIEETAELVSFFKEHTSRQLVRQPGEDCLPHKVILLGQSMGALIALKSVEDPSTKSLYDGVIACCGPLSGATSHCCWCCRSSYTRP